MNVELSRRELLRRLGIGAGLVPLLNVSDAFAQGTGAAPKRLLIVHQTGGVVGSSFFPTEPDLSRAALPPVLAPLEPYKRHLVVFDGLRLQNFLDYPNHGAGHENYACTYTGNKGPVIQDGGPRFLGTGPTPDQVVAEELAKKVTLPVRSLHLAAQVDDHQGRDFFRRCFWKGPGRAVTPEHDPGRAAAAVFGGGAVRPMPTGSAEKLQQERSKLLAHVGRDIEAFSKRVGREDRDKILGHLAALSALQKQLGTLTPAATRSCKNPVEAPPPVKDPLRYKDIVEAHFDLVATAFACDVTRVATVQLTDAAGTFTVFPGLPISTTNSSFTETNRLGLRNYHDVQHGGGSDKVKVDAWFMERFAGLLRRLAAIPEGVGRTALDNTVVLWGNHMGNGGAHDSGRLPWLLAGSCGGYFKTGQAIRRTAPTNGVLVALCNAMGFPRPFFHEEKYGGELPGLRA